MDLKNTKILQSYHLTRQLSEQVEIGNNEGLNSSVTTPVDVQDRDIMKSVTSPFLRKNIAEQAKINEEIMGKAGKKLS